MAQRRRVDGRSTGLARFEIPEPLRIDQSELCKALEKATLAGGRTGLAAKRLLRALQPHLLEEEQDLLPILGLLVPLAQGQNVPGLQQIPRATERLKARISKIAHEHVTIIGLARQLLRAARFEHKLRLADFTERLLLRAWMDEVVFYPSAVLVGEYLKLKSPPL